MKKQDYAFCKLFEIGDLGNNFEFEQFELKEPVPHGDTISFTKTLNKFVVKNSSNIDKISGAKPLALLCIKNNVDLLKFTYSKMKFYYTFDHIDLLVIDDRTTDSSIEDFCKSENLPYVRVENSLDEFNFSVLNNIGAYFAKKAGCETIILWNSDLWPCDKNSIVDILEKHEKHGCTISGTKLIYPKVSHDGSSGESDNIKTHFPKLTGKWRGTIQFGGSQYYLDQNSCMQFVHDGRFKASNFWRSNTDKPELFITGAFQVIQLQWFLENGGLHCSLANQLQDVELCLRALRENKTIYYFGKNMLEHDESLVQFNQKTKQNQQAKIDHMLFTKINTANSFYDTLLK